ncbi:hypothetical protein D3C81_1651390 [compost metagenome]
MLERPGGVAQEALQCALQRLPIGQDAHVDRGLGLRGNPGQTRNTGLRFVQAPGAEQCSGIHVNQVRAALEQSRGQARTPVEPSMKIALD